MKSIITLHATPNAWLTNSVLAPHLDAFIAYLQSRPLCCRNDQRAI